MSKHVRYALIAVVAVAFLIFVYLFNHNVDLNFNNMVGEAYTTYEKGKVLEIVDETLEPNPNVPDQYRGTQQMIVEIKSGEHKGEFHEITNYLSSSYNIFCDQGDTIILSIDTATKDYYVVSVYSYYRAPLLYALILLFIFVLVAIGGKKGFRSIIGIVFTLFCIIYVFIPMLYRGYSPIVSSILIAIITTFVTLFLLNGWSKKTLTAFLGTSIGVIFSGSIAMFFGNLAHISGLQTSEAETLIVIARDQGMQVHGLLFASILIASLGAIMDVAMSIASSLGELKNVNKKMPRNKLFQSGIAIGRDMMGTMSNTLILAFTGSSLNTLILLYSYDVGYNQLINMNPIAIEVIQGVSGSIGIILTVPITAFITAYLLTKKK